MEAPLTARRDFYVYALYRDVEMMTPFYYGKGCRGRMEQHARPQKGDRSHRANTIRHVKAKLGFLPMRRIAENLPEDAAWALEMRLINHFGQWPEGTLVNRTPGGDGHPKGRGGHRWTLEERAKLSATNTGRKMPPEAVAKTAAANRGRKRSVETRQRLREAHLGQEAWNKGVPMPLDTKAKMIAALTGKVRGPNEARNKAISELIWITDGNINRRIQQTLEIPVGWYRGRSGLVTDEFRKNISAGLKGKRKLSQGEKVALLAASQTPGARAKRSASLSPIMLALWNDPVWKEKQIKLIAEGRARSTQLSAPKRKK
jgi:hypothetical protein